MGHRIVVGPHPFIREMWVTEGLTAGDMTCSDELDLNEGHPIYVLLDTSEMNQGLPAGFLEGARNSYFIHENLAHMALYTNSALLDTVGNMVAKMTARRNKLTTHKTRAGAMAHLVSLIEKANQ